MYNLLTDPLITAELADGERSRFALPEVFAAMIRNEVAGFPALRPHQSAAWHCFLAQLGALTLHRAEKTTLPDTPEDWRDLLRGLTPDFADEEPWRLIVEDGAKPAFLQPPEPTGIRYTGRAETADMLDMLIGQKNHDLKDDSLQHSAPEDWIFALISKQTGDGFNGSGNYGIARMNGGSSSRLTMGLAPLAAQQAAPTPGGRLRHDLMLLRDSRTQQLKENAALQYPERGGIALLWLFPWPLEEKSGLALQELDIWFIEICRRIRLQQRDQGIYALTGTSKKERVAAKANKGNIGDPWAPVEKSGKTITFGERRFSYKAISDWLFKGDFTLPVSLRGADLSRHDGDWALILQVIGRGNSKTHGYHERRIIFPREIGKYTLTEREKLQRLSKELMDEIAVLDRALGHAIAIAASHGRGEGPKKDNYGKGKYWRDQLDDLADRQFFPTLWKIFEATLEEDDQAHDAAKHHYLRALIGAAEAFLNEACDSVAGATFRHRARARAQRRFYGGIRKEFDWYKSSKKETDHAAA